MNRALLRVLAWAIASVACSQAQAHVPTCPNGQHPEYTKSNAQSIYQTCAIGHKVTDPNDFGGCFKEVVSACSSGIRTTIGPNGNLTVNTAGHIVTMGMQRTRSGCNGTTFSDHNPNYGTDTISYTHACVIDDEPQNPCEHLEGKKKSMPGRGHLGAGCNTNNNCAMLYSSTDKVFRWANTAEENFTQQGTYTGGECPPNAPQEQPHECAPGEFCPEDEKACGTQGGEEFCVSETQPNCGTVKVGGVEQSVCAGPGLGDGECTTTPGGQMVCIQPGLGIDDKPDTPPAPNTAQHGQPAKPDASIQNPGTATTVHVYGAGTVTNSTHNEPPPCDPATEQCPGEPNHDGDGKCEQGEQGSEDCNGSCEESEQESADCGGCDDGEEGQECDGLSGGADCTEPPTCDGNPIDCYIAKQEWTQSCLYHRPTSTKGNEAFEAGLGKTLQEGNILPVHGTVDAGQWMESLVLGEGTCLPDITFSVSLPIAGAVGVTLPLSHACAIVRLVRALVILAALYAGFQIYMKGFAAATGGGEG